jgi:hypothetical protein
LCVGSTHVCCLHVREIGRERERERKRKRKREKDREREGERERVDVCFCVLFLCVLLQRGKVLDQAIEAQEHVNATRYDSAWMVKELINRSLEVQSL